jgi:peroxiredoxin
MDIGSTAPDFRLPSAQGPDICLGDFRGRRNVIVWFHKGLMCPFCRRHMVQLAAAAPQIGGLQTEVLQVTSTFPEQARIYHRRFVLPFLYLCDPDHAVAKTWGLAVRPHSAQRFLRRLPDPPGKTPFDNVHPIPGEVQNLLLDDDTGFFIVDRVGIVRYTQSGPSYSSRSWRIPSNETVLTELERL